MKVKAGKEEIVYLLGKVIEKFESSNNVIIIKNSNRKNYEGVARMLSEISNQLPHTAATLQHDEYAPDLNPKDQEYPFRKYDITGNQVKDAFFHQIVAHPRSFLVDACYIYLYGMGRKGFEQNPVDEQLLIGYLPATKDLPEENISQTIPAERLPVNNRQLKIFKIACILLGLGLGIVTVVFFVQSNKWKTIRNDMGILPYQPTQAEIDSLVGVWICYTGSPQARPSDSHRYHLVVLNIVDVKYKNGYFTFDRYGASFDHGGYMQYESPWLVSIHSHIKNKKDSIESPRHSLMRLDQEPSFISVISASWNFDVGNFNNIIGIREVYLKQGKGGRIEEVINTVENASCRCKIIKWHQDNSTVKTYYLRNEPLSSLPDSSLRSLLDDKSILLRVPQRGLVITDTSGNKK